MNKSSAVKPEIVRKPILTGSWHGADAWRLAGKRALSLLAVTIIYLVAGLMLSFDSLLGRIATSLLIVAAVCYYEYAQGATRGESDAALGEIMYGRLQEGKDVPDAERERCVHPAKGFFASFAGALPFVLFTLVFACITAPVEYKLGVLPSWTKDLLRHDEFGDALRYYGQSTGLQPVDVARVIDRACVMPFINVASYISDSATLLVERLSPLLVLLPSCAFGLGYTRGRELRDRINTGIKLGDEKKKRRERKARRQRQQSKAPERLI